MNQNQKLGLGIVGIIVAIGTFGPGSRSGQPRPRTEQTTSSTTTTTETGTRGESEFEIEPASSKQLRLIQGMLERGLTVREAFAVRSKSHTRGYYVGGKIYGPGMGRNGAPAVWIISGEKNDPGVILSVNAVAAEFSAPMLAAKTDAEARSTDPEAEAILVYLQRD